MNRFFEEIKEFFLDIEDPAEPKYDPVHVAGMIVIVLLANTVLFWLLWSLLVFGGGIQAKVLPFLAVLFTSKTAGDFGYVGYPYEMGVFEGWVTNVVALALAVFVLWAFWYAYNNSYTGKRKDINEDKKQQET
ncbi:MAG: hypothetical protein JW803_08380 [Endomicrobiales bacterium]|nr:hypothetical protein [Endomicrobiales bacterium]